LWPSWSPDGNQIAFNSWQDGRNIWLVPAIGGTPGRLATSDNNSNAVWSADGTQVAYVLKDSTGLPHAEVYMLSAHKRRKVTLPGEQWERNYLSWSPDGGFFAYTDADNLYREADISAVKIVRIADGKDYHIPNEGALDFFPIWSRIADTFILFPTGGAHQTSGK